MRLVSIVAEAGGSPAHAAAGAAAAAVAAAARLEQGVAGGFELVSADVAPFAQPFVAVEAAAYLEVVGVELDVGDDIARTGEAVRQRELDVVESRCRHGLLVARPRRKSNTPVEDQTGAVMIFQIRRSGPASTMIARATFRRFDE